MVLWCYTFGGKRRCPPPMGVHPFATTTTNQLGIFPPSLGGGSSPSAPGSGAMAVTPRTAHANHDFPSQYPCMCLSHARRCGWTIRRGQWTGAGGLGGQLQKWSAHSTCTRTAAWDACSHVSRRRDDHKIATTSSPWPRKRARSASHGARLLWRQAAVVHVYSDADASTLHFYRGRASSAEP